MADIFDYLHWRGDLTLQQAQFQEIDALILARLAYVPFEECSRLKAGEALSLREAADELGKREDLSSAVFYKEDRRLLPALAESGRYGSMLLRSCVNRIDEETQMQFSAVTFQLGEKLRYISFRGTDNTLVAWKENFNMSFICPVPAQESAVKYLEEAAADFDGQLIVGGHSKGGNLAMYAASFCEEKVQEQICSIYNFDGPGFDGKIIASPQYQKMREKMATFVPQSSIVGMLLEHEEQYIIVRSTEITGCLQHDVYSWLVERDHLVYLDHVTGSSQMIDHTLKDWVREMEPEQREQFVEALYSIVSQTNAHTVQELGTHWMENAWTILLSIGTLDEKTRKLITASLIRFMKNIEKNVTVPGSLKHLLFES